MFAFPAVKTFNPKRITDQPKIVRTQVIILIPNVTDVFVTIPDVTVRNHGRRGIDDGRRCGIDQWLRSHHHEGQNPHHSSIWLNDTARQ
jgi:hypothetical protein